MKIDIRLHAYVLLFHNLPVGTTPKEISEWAWQETGLSLEPEFIGIRPAGDLRCTAIAPVSRHALADFFERMLADKKFCGQSVVVRSAGYQNG